VHWNGGGANKTLDITSGNYARSELGRGNTPIPAGFYFEMSITTDAGFLPASLDLVAGIELEW
jgi:hypothetical protein